MRGRWERLGCFDRGQTQRPLSPQKGRCIVGMSGFWQRDGDGKLSGPQESIAGEAQHGVRDVAVVVEVWPRTREPHENSAGTGDDFGSYFDQTCLPRCGVSFAERVLPTTLVEVTATLPATHASVGSASFGSDVGLATACRNRTSRL